VNSSYDILVIGGGAAGFFTAINSAENAPHLSVAILERGKEVLTKVRISGGGRCNVTHAEFVPSELVGKYPRGEKELLGPFHTFMTGDTIAWFEERGVDLKIEEDGRMFPISDSSETIIQCFMREIEHLKIPVLTNHSVKTIKKNNELWEVVTQTESFAAKNIVVATGSNPKIWSVLKHLNHTIIPPVPSLFTFNIKDDRLNDLQGISTNASIEVVDTLGKTILKEEGPLLITHWGLSGPAVLKLSAWGARMLHELDYCFSVRVNWLFDTSQDEIREAFKTLRSTSGKQGISTYAQFELPKRLWQAMVASVGIEENLKWADLTRSDMDALANQLTAAIYTVSGKSTFKEEFVTAGGVDLGEVNFKTFESKLNSNLYLAGEVLNIDAITGGYNFQNAWTGGFMIAQAITKDA